MKSFRTTAATAATTAVTTTGARLASSKKVKRMKRFRTTAVTTAATATGARLVSSKKVKRIKRRCIIVSDTNDEYEAVIEENSLGLIVEFLSTPDLVSFRDCSKLCEYLVAREVASRKIRIAKMNDRVRKLLGLDINNKNRILVPTRSDILEAKNLCEEARCIIDTDLDWHDLINDTNNEGNSCSDDKNFKKERRLLRSARDLCMLPSCFYMSPRQGVEPSRYIGQAELDLARNQVEYVWNEQYHMQNTLENYYIEIMECDYEDPFRKFDLPGAEFFVDFVDDVAGQFARSSPSSLDALRIEGRKFVLNKPETRDYIHFLIHCADQIVTAERETTKKDKTSSS
jgi:hypothetical protein